LYINNKNGFFIDSAVNYSMGWEWRVVSRTVHIMSILDTSYTIKSVTERCAKIKFASDVLITWISVMKILIVRQKYVSWNVAHNISFFLMKCVHYSSPSVNGELWGDWEHYAKKSFITCTIHYYDDLIEKKKDVWHTW
jgi:alpha-glucuronidase